MASLMLRSLVLLVLLAGSAEAASWYWRPVGSGGTNAGNSYTNAWTSTASINWNGMASGDTLYVCGLHDSGNVNDRVLGATRSNITISGACYNGTTRDFGTVIATGLKLGTGGTAFTSGPDANGIYTYTAALTQTHNYAMNERFERVWLTTGALTGANPCNRFYVNGTASIQYKPCRAAGSGPGTLYVSYSAPEFIVANNLTNLVVRDLKLYLYYYGMRIIGGSNIRLHNVHMRTFAHTNDMIQLTGLLNGLTITGSTFCDGGSGIYGYGAKHWADAGPSGWRGDLHKQSNVSIIGNRFCELWFGNDSHAIGMQGGDNWTIRGNHMHDGEGVQIALYLPSNNNLNADDPSATGPESAWTIHNAVVENNVFSDIRTHTCATGDVCVDTTNLTTQQGISVTGHYSCERIAGAFRNIVIRNNVFARIDRHGVYVETARTDDGTPAVRVIGNDFTNVVSDDVRNIPAIAWGAVIYGQAQGCTETTLGGTSMMAALNSVRGSVEAISPVMTATSQMMTNFSQITMRRNVYGAGTLLFWPSGPGQTACTSNGGTWAQFGNYCSFPTSALAGFRTYSSGREQGTVSVVE